MEEYLFSILFMKKDGETGQHTLKTHVFPTFFIYFPTFTHCPFAHMAWWSHTHCLCPHCILSYFLSISLFSFLRASVSLFYIMQHLPLPHGIFPHPQHFMHSHDMPVVVGTPKDRTLDSCVYMSIGYYFICIFMDTMLVITHALILARGSYSIQFFFFFFSILVLCYFFYTREMTYLLQILGRTNNMPL